jgi:hypothetical protein
MRQEDTVDTLIQAALRAAVQAEEPSAHVRDLLLASAASSATPRSVLGLSIPAIVSDLQECNKRDVELDEPVLTSIPLGRRQLLLLAVPLYAVR